VDAGRHWILHAGDSFYHHAQVDDTGHAPRTLTGMERVVAYDWRKVKANHQRLQQLWNHAEPDLLVVNAQKRRYASHKDLAKAAPANPALTPTQPPE
jgi:hypothetical protein